MRCIISLNGVDGSGKTTQIELLKKKNPNLIETFGGLESYQPYNVYGVEGGFDWWFRESSPEDFCRIMYQSLQQRNLEIQKSQKPIVIVDKGIKNFDARITATLMTKGLDREEALQLITKMKEQYGVRGIEDFDIFMDIAGSVEERMKISEVRTYSNMSPEKANLYRQYQLYQNVEINNQLANREYVDFYATGSIEKVEFNLNELLYELLKSRIVVPKQQVILGLGGLSECGKSGAGRYLSTRYDSWNLKLNYFVEKICKKYGIFGQTEFFENDHRYTSLLQAEEIAKFLRIHYYKSMISVESLHRIDLVEDLKDIFEEQFRAVFIDTSYKNRVVRNAISEGIDIQQSMEDVSKKDAIKISRGADKIKNIADYIIDNNGTKKELDAQLDNVALQTNSKLNPNIRGVDELQIPDQYKQAIQTCYEECSKQLNTKLKLFLIHGSCARETVIEGYSDIDLILVVEPNDSDTRRILNSIVSKFTNIKIGTTVYGQSEFERLDIDAKTTYAISKIETGEYFPTFCVPELQISRIDRTILKNKYKESIPDQVHTLRRLLYDDKVDTKKADSVFKIVSHIMRAMLIQEDVDAKGYFDVYKKFADRFGIKEFNAQEFIKCRTTGISNNFSAVEYGNEFLDFLIQPVRMEGNKKMKRVASRGIILKDGKLVTIHRIKEKDGKREEYYVFPGGGVEGEETIEKAVVREIKEELGIDVNVVRPLYRLEKENNIEHFLLCEYLSGDIGTGTGPEFTSEDYKDRGLYIPELVDINEVGDKLLPQIVSNAMRIDLRRFGGIDKVPKKDLTRVYRMQMGLDR